MLRTSKHRLSLGFLLRHRLHEQRDGGLTQLFRPRKRALATRPILRTRDGRSIHRLRWVLAVSLEGISEKTLWQNRPDRNVGAGEIPCAVT